jgi:hypothetical protein
LEDNLCINFASIDQKGVIPEGAFQFAELELAIADRFDKRSGNPPIFNGVQP